MSSRLKVSLAGGEGLVKFGRNWFVPGSPEVAVDGYTMRFTGYQMHVNNEIYTEDPAPRDFANHLQDNFDEYCRHYPVFRELVRLHKLVEVARWYYDSEFPVQPILDNYEPLPVKTMNTTKQKEGPTRSQREGNTIYQMQLMGGVNFSPPNKYIPANQVPAQNLQVGVPTGPLRFQSSVGTAPARYGSFAGPAPAPNYVNQLFDTRPSPNSMNWQTTVGTRTIRVALIPVPNALSAPQLPSGPPLDDSVAVPPPPPFSLTSGPCALTTGKLAVRPTDRYGSQTAAALSKGHDFVQQKRAEDDEFYQSVQSVAPDLPMLDLTVNGSKVVWSELTLNRSATGLDAFRFRSPLDVPADLYWSFVLPSEWLGEWYIMPTEDTMKGFENFYGEVNLKVDEVHPIPLS